MQDTLIGMFEACVHRRGGARALRFHRSGGWESLTWKAWWGASERLAAALVGLGVEPGDRVAILSETRPEWLVADIGIMMAGAVTVPLYPSATVDLTAHILSDAAPRVAIVENPSQLDKISRAGDSNASIEHVLVMEPEANFLHGDWDGRSRVALSDVSWDKGRHLRNLDTALAEGRRALADDSMLISRRRAELRPDQLATIVYTSGTEALPKGVMLTHENIRAEAAGIDQLELLEPNDVQLLFLPLAHIFARALVVAAIGAGIETVVGRGPAKLLDDARQVRPTFFAAVPQVFERLQTSIEIEAAQQGGWKGRVLDVAVAPASGTLAAVGQRVARELLHRRLVATLGGRIRFLVSGGAPLPRDTCEFFCAAGIPLIEGYGLTETTAVTCANHPADVRPGTVGRPLPGVEVAIDEDGEILVRGATVTRGYWPDEEVLDEDGWLATGDLGQFDRDGYLTITGRKKEMIVTSGGKNIAPGPVQARLRASSLIADAYLHGDARPYVVALIVPDVEAVTKRAADEGVELPPVQEWAKNDFVRRVVGDVVEEVNSQRARYESIRRWVLVRHPFEEARGERTPTGKLRRDKIAATRREEIEALYSDDTPAIPRSGDADR